MPSISENIEQLQKTEAELKTKQEELDKAKATITDYEAKKSGLEAEHNRVLEQIKEAKAEKEKLNVKEESFSQKIISENTQKAKQKVMMELGIKPEDFKSIEEAYSAIQNKPVSEDGIRDELLSVYASKNAKSLIESRKKLMEQTEAAGSFSAGQSNSGSLGSGFTNPMKEVQLDESDIQAAKWAGVTLDVYKKWRQEGKV